SSPSAKRDCTLANIGRSRTIGTRTEAIDAPPARRARRHPRPPRSARSLGARDGAGGARGDLLRALLPPPRRARRRDAPPRAGALVQRAGGDRSRRLSPPAARRSRALPAALAASGSVDGPLHLFPRALSGRGAAPTPRGAL